MKKQVTCPACQEDIAPPNLKRCPFCGAQILRMQSGVIKTSAVMIVSDDVQGIFPSLRDVPEPLRKRVMETTSGRNSGTIVIADRRGKEEIEKAARVERLPREDEKPAERTMRWRQFWPAMLALLVGAAGAWLAFIVRW